MRSQTDEEVNSSSEVKSLSPSPNHYPNDKSLFCTYEQESGFGWPGHSTAGEQMAFQELSGKWTRTKCTIFRHFKPATIPQITDCWCSFHGTIRSLLLQCAHIPTHREIYPTIYSKPGWSFCCSFVPRRVVVHLKLHNGEGRNELLIAETFSWIGPGRLLILIPPVVPHSQCDSSKWPGTIV